jgi:hypothetical protein
VQSSLAYIHYFIKAFCSLLLFLIARHLTLLLIIIGVVGTVDLESESLTLDEMNPGQVSEMLIILKLVHYVHVVSPTSVTLIFVIDVYIIPAVKVCGSPALGPTKVRFNGSRASEPLDFRPKSGVSSGNTWA